MPSEKLFEKNAQKFICAFFIWVSDGLFYAVRSLGKICDACRTVGKEDGRLAAARLFPFVLEKSLQQFLAFVCKNAAEYGCVGV